MFNAARTVGFGVGGLLLFVLTANAQTTVTYGYSGLPLAIATDAADVISIANVFVPQALTISKVTARVQIQYPNISDLKIYLFSPFGTRTVLLEHDCSIANVDTTFDDAAPSLWKEFCPTDAGRGPFRSDQPLSNFNGDDSSFGAWSLAVENDSSDSRTGWITNLSLTITGTPQLSPVSRVQTIVNAASLASPGIVAPGELISIFGVRMGPETPVSASAGALPTSLGGTTVTFNGQAVPIARASLYRADVQAPFSLTPGGTATVQVTANGASSSSFSLATQDAVPAVYTTGIIGRGPAAAANQDGTKNSTSAPASKGSYISVYATGLGTVNPAVVEGAVPPSAPLSITTAQIQAFIGGVASPVQFAGAAPQLPGRYQVNLQVPATAPSGAVELLIYANGKPSQSGVTVQIQ